MPEVAPHWGWLYVRWGVGDIHFSMLLLFLAALETIQRQSHANDDSYSEPGTSKLRYSKGSGDKRL